MLVCGWLVFEGADAVPDRANRTETCSFSEERIYPGHGSRYIRRDGSAYVFINAKSKSMFMQRKKATKIVWTLGWRRMNKKLKVEEVSRRRARKTTKIQRAIVGVSADDAKKAVTKAEGVKKGAKGGNAPRAQKKSGNRGAI
ncbi:hypothetical protein BBJ28_00018343 [Nothophytophthora sp. Chile5]|nr:hypothetical protein BBJ28_00018343 [Nothophytophthora sp. Chile5]